MGAAVHEKIRGRKGGSSKPKQPSIAQDSLQSVAYAKLLLAVGEGEFAEAPTERDIYLDNTPLMDASGNYNFPNVKWAWRPGTVDQDYIPGIPSVENEATVNVELRSDTPWIRSINNTQLSAVRLRFAWPALQKQDTSGNVTGYRIEYAVDVSTDGGAYVEVLNEAVDGKTTSRYERTRRIDLPAATSGWQIRVRRLTPNQNSSLIADTMLIAGLTEVIDAKLRYPNTALLYVEFSAEQFSNIPAVTVECGARKVQVPTTYDPIARTYSGVWDGSFKSAWTNNPAWITYDVSTNNRFGLGRRVRPWMVDKWELYKVAQYCDQLVPDGKGGQEPRFLCDLNLQKRADAWQLLRDIAAIYRGMSYWAQGQIVTQADMPRTVDFDYVFTRANVIGGTFSYGGGSARTRYSRALVSYDNPDNNYDTDVTPYSEPALQRRYGDNVVEVSAIGCTRESEAKRRGAWVVLTGVQDRVVTFSTGLEGRIPQPGYIIPVADSLLAGREIGGRISAVAGRVITLDRGTSAKPGDRLIINLPSGVAQARTVQSVSGRAVTVTTAYSETPEPELCWALDADDLALQLYRVLKAKRGDDAWTITGLQYDPSKFDRIDTGARLEDRPISVIPVTTVPAPAEITLTSRWAVDQGLAVSTMTIAWSPVAGAVAYDVEWKKDSGNWIRLPRQGTTSVDITGIYAGAYLARVRAVSAVEVTSIWKVSELKQLVGKDGAPPAIAFLRTAPRVMGIDLEWGFPDGASDTQRTEIWYSTSPSRDAGNPLGDFAYPQNVHTMQGLAAGVTFFFWARLVDRTGNVGPWFPEGIGISGQSSVDATELLGYLAGQIGETELGQHLIDRIAVGEGAAAAVEVQQRELAQQAALLSDALAGAAQDLADERDQRSSGQKAQADALQAEIKARQDAVEAVAGDLLQEVLDRKQQVAEVRDGLTDRIAALDAAVSDILGTAEYSADVAVAAGGLVTYSGKLYRAKVAMSPPVPVPTNTQYWTLLGDYTSLGEAVGDLASRMATAETVQAGQAQRLAAVESTSASSASRVSALEQTTAGQASTLQQLKTSDTQQSSNIANLQQTTAQQAQAVQELQTTTGSQGAAITSLQQTDVAHAQSLQELQADVQDLEGQTAGQASALQSLDAKVTQHDGALTSQGQAITSLDSRLDGVEGVNDAQAQAITGLTSRVTSAEGALTSQAQSLTSLGSSLDRTALDALYEGEADADLAAATEGTKANASAISGLSTTVEQQGDLLVSQAQSITTLTADVADLESGAAAQSQALQSLETKVTQQGDTLVSQGAAITSLDSRVDGVEGVNDAQAQAIGTLATRVSNAEGVLSSQAQSLTSLGSSLDRTALDGMYSGEADAGLAAAKQDSAAAATAVQSLSTKVEQQGDAIVAQGAAVTALDTRLTAAEGAATGQASALQQLDSKVTQQGDALTAQASSLSLLSAEVDDASAVVQTTQQAVADLQDGLQAMYSVKLQVTSNGKIYGAGMGIGIENTPSGMQSQVLFRADRFAVINTANGQISTPFVIQGGQVFINSAIIGDGTIGMAKIASALQSTNYVAGQSGWRLTQAGQFELNANVAGQGRLTMSNQLIQVFDSNGTLRVRLGIW